MNSKQKVTSTYKGTANPAGADPFVLDMTNEVIPLLERRCVHENRSLEDLESISRALHEVLAVIKDMPNSDQKKNIKRQIRVIAPLLDKQYNDQVDDIVNYQRCIRAFKKTAEVPRGRAGEMYLALFAQKLNAIEDKDVSVGAMLDESNAVTVESEVLSKYFAKESAGEEQDAGLSSKKAKVTRVQQNLQQKDAAPVLSAPRKNV